jgi:hypothetical protein
MDPIVFYMSNYYSKGTDSNVDRLITSLRNARKDEQNVVVIDDSQRNTDAVKMNEKGGLHDAITGANCILLLVTEDYIKRIQIIGDCYGDELKAIRSSEKPVVTIVYPSAEGNDITERVIKHELKLKNECFHSFNLRSANFEEEVKQLVAKCRKTIRDCTPRQPVRSKSPLNRFFFLALVLLGVTVVRAVSPEYLAKSLRFLFPDGDAPVVKLEASRRCLFEESFIPLWNANFTQWNDQFGEFSLHWPQQYQIVQNFHKLSQGVTSQSDYGLVLDYDSPEKQFLSSFHPKMTRFDNKIRNFETCYLILLNNVEAFQMNAAKYLSYLRTGYKNGWIDAMILEIQLFRESIAKLREVIENTVKCSDSIDSETSSIINEVRRSAMIFSIMDEKVKSYSSERKETINELEGQV